MWELTALSCDIGVVSTWGLSVTARYLRSHVYCDFGVMYVLSRFAIQNYLLLCLLTVELIVTPHMLLS
jgi:hypothetical protein